MSTMNWTTRATDPITTMNKLALKITAYELQSSDGEWRTTEKRGVLLKGLAPLAEVKKHVMKD